MPVQVGIALSVRVSLIFLFRALLKLKSDPGGAMWTCTLVQAGPRLRLGESRGRGTAPGVDCFEFEESGSCRAGDVAVSERS